MLRFLIRTVVFLASSAVGLLVADLVLADFTIDARSFVLDVVVFAVLQSVLSPFIFKVAASSAPAILGGVGLVSTFVALLITELVSSGFTITGAQTWLFATLIVWIVTMLATLLLPLLLVKRAVTDADGRSSSNRQRF
ncbi:MAG TPA: hypothetical protein VIC82_08810 [Candidatus Nanopelagicales bacterium]|jgi:hypothetical protein